MFVVAVFLLVKMTTQKWPRYYFRLMAVEQSWCQVLDPDEVDFCV
jgi:hypothetical protein